MTKKITDFRPQAKNANKHTPYGLRLLEKSVQGDGWLDAQTAAADGEIISGSARIELAAEKFADVEPIIVDSDGTRPVIIRRTDIPNANTARARRLSVAANKIAQVDFDPDWALLKEWGGEDEQIKKLFSDDEWREGTGEEKPMGDAEPQIDRAAELQEKWQTCTGQLWSLGNHRLLIGDCTIRENVERLMGGCKVNLVHADSPYGMGKSEIENDNLYNEKLDLFQMQWFDQCRAFIADNSSVYIWGTAEDLWRLWFGKLSKSERMTIRNEIVWDKERGMGQGSNRHRMYPTGSERCLFFVLGEQGYNANADNYWKGWDSIRLYLSGEIDKLKKLQGWSLDDIGKLNGVSSRMIGHFINESQFEFVAEKYYKEWQNAANGSAFKKEYDELKKEYDELKKEFYATRAPFDNTHENMTDVWRYSVQLGLERPDHPTPKPVEMMERIFKTSGTDDAVIYSPFLGSGTDIIAGENCGIPVYGLEKDANYGAVILERFATAFPAEEIRLIE
jgi:DNA modification methylase